MASKEQLLQNGLHVEGQGRDGVPAPPCKELPPGRVAPGATPSKTLSPTPGPAVAAPKPAETPRPEAPKAAKPSCLEKSPRDPRPGGSPPAPAPVPSKGPQRCSEVPAKERDAGKRTGPEGTKKEKGAPPSHEQPSAKARTKRELGLVRKEPEKMKKDVGGGKKEPSEIKNSGKNVNKAEGPKEEPGGIQEKSEDGAKEVGKVKLGEGKEAPGESKETDESTDKDQVTCLQTCRDVTLCLGAPMSFSGFMQLFSFGWAQPGWGKVLGGQRRDRILAGGVAVCGAGAVCPAHFSARSCTVPLSPPRRLRGMFGTKRRRSGSSSRMDSRSVTCLGVLSPPSAEDTSCLQPGWGSGVGLTSGAAPAPCHGHAVQQGLIVLSLQPRS